MKWFWRGALFGIVGTFPLAGLCALVYRFPIPLSGYASGFGAVAPAMVAVLFYGFLGGFVVQAILGGLGGVAASKFAHSTPSLTQQWCVTLSVAAASFGVIFLAILDHIIGPW